MTFFPNWEKTSLAFTEYCICNSHNLFVDFLSKLATARTTTTFVSLFHFIIKIELAFDLCVFEKKNCSRSLLKFTSRGNNNMKCATTATSPVVIVPRYVESTNNTEVNGAHDPKQTDSSITRRRCPGTRVVPRDELQQVLDTIIALIENDCKDGSMMFHHPTQDAVSDDNDEDEDGSSKTRKRK